ncbi:hypothetical protein HW555_000827 [Spodoptera exigua]|uniref:Uncharacterized protein n=1 Tax=Spodoptera exigua TaxID=7107 RepID=A0A835GTF2_SPOEX|nr:hypothetical protein HW555_000827 [Spodoptera exigua]
MSEYSDLVKIHESVQESVTRRMNEMEAQIQSAGQAKDTVAKVAEEFRSFRELIFKILGLLRSQINECSRRIDDMETRHRRKALVFQGLVETEKEDCRKLICNVINSKMSLDISESEITVCHRLGVGHKDHHRPILVRFSSLELKASVWRAKAGLRGSTYSVKEFLTKTRQTLFTKARQHFGMRSCWTQDGIIYVKAGDGSRHRVTSIEALDLLLLKFPRAPGNKSDHKPSGGNLKK